MRHGLATLSKALPAWKRQASEYRALEYPSYQNPPPRTRLPLVQKFFPLRSRHRQLHKTVERRTQAKKPFHHTCEQEGPAAHKLIFVQFNLYANASRKRRSVVRAHRRELPTAADLDHTIDDVLRIRGAPNVVEAKNLLKRLPTLFDQRQIVERQMRNQPPQRTLPRRRAHRRRRLAQRNNPLQRGRAFQFKVSLFQSKRQTRRQIAIGAGRPNRKNISIWSHGPHRQVHQRQKHLRPLVIGPRRRTAPRRPETLLLASRRRMPKRIKRLECSRLLRRGVDAGNLVDRINLRRIGPPHVWRQRVLVSPLRQPNWLCHLRKQIHHGRATQAKRLLREFQFQPLPPPVAFHISQQKNKLDTLVESRLPQHF